MQTFSPRRMTTLALLCTMALALYAVESLLPPLVPIPGVKLGLANIITLVILRDGSGKDAFWVLILRIILASVLFGQMVSALYSLAGGLCCFCVMYAANRLFQGHFLFLIGILGAISHNLGQIGIALLLTGTPGILSYLPFLLLAGILTGFFTGLCADFLNRHLRLLTSGSPSGPGGDDEYSEQSR